MFLYKLTDIPCIAKIKTSNVHSITGTVIILSVNKIINQNELKSRVLQAISEAFFAATVF